MRVALSHGGDTSCTTLNRLIRNGSLSMSVRLKYESFTHIVVAAFITCNNLQDLPGSYKMWFNYITERKASLQNLPITHPQFEELNDVFERAMAYMHKVNYR